MRTDSSSALEDLSRVMRRLGMVNSSPLSSLSTTRHSDIYSAILQLVLSSQPSNVRVFRLGAYSRAEVNSAGERRLLSSILSLLGRVQVKYFRL